MNQRGMFAFRTKRSVAFCMPKNLLRVCYAAAGESVHKRDGLCCPEGFPSRVSLVSLKNHWERARLASLLVLALPEGCLYSPGGESEEAVGKGWDSSPKKGLFGNHLLLLRYEDQPA